MLSHARVWGAGVIIALASITLLLSGGAHIESVALITVCVTLMTSALLALRKSFILSIPGPLALLILALFVGTLIQWIPLPFGFIQYLSPSSVQQFEFAYHGLELPRQLTWSLAPSLTFQKSLQYLTLLTLVLLVSWTRGGAQEVSRYRSEEAFLVLGTVLCAIVLASEYFEIRFFEYHERRSWVGLGPFINPNHGGGFAALMTMWCLHGAQKTRGTFRLVGITLGLVFSVLVAMSLSRGAILALGLGFLVAMSIPVISRRRLSKPSMIMGLLLMLGFVALIVTERDALVPVVRELVSLKTESGHSKMTPWRGVPELLMTYPFGTGVGGLYPVLPQLNLPLTSTGRIFYLENQVLQLLSDWGPVLGSGLLLGFLNLLIKISKRELIHSNPFFFAGLCVAFVQNLVDFNASLLTMQILLTLGYTAFYLRHHPSEGVMRMSNRSAALMLCLCLGITGGGATLYGLTGMQPTFASFQDSVSSADTGEEVEQELKEYKKLHPLDVFADLIIAKRLTELEAPRKDILARVNVAMSLQPHFAEPHLLASQILRRFGATEQALGEYLLAFQKNSHKAWTFSKRYLTRLASPSMAKRVTMLEPSLRYKLWNALKAESVFLPDLVLSDQDWLQEPGFIQLRTDAHFSLRDYEGVLNDCELWRKTYPSFATCDELEFRALDSLGRNAEVVAELERLWRRDPYDGKLAWSYLSRLRGKEGCKVYLEVWDRDGRLIRFDSQQASLAKMRELDCVVELDYRNRFDGLVETRLSKESLDPSVLQHTLSHLRSYRPKEYLRRCSQSRKKWESVLGVPISCL